MYRLKIITENKKVDVSDDLINIFSEDRRKFEVNRRVFSLKSEYFRLLFKYDSKKDIVMHGLSGKTLADIISFLEGKKVEIDIQNAMHLLKAADYLVLPKIWKYIRKCLYVVLTPENCVEFFNTATSFYFKDIAALTTFYITTHFGQIMRGTSVKHLPLGLMIDVLSSDKLNISSETEVWDAIVIWIKADIQSRSIHVLRLLRCMRLENCSKLFIRFMMKHSIIRENELCKGLFIDMRIKPKEFLKRFGEICKDVPLQFLMDILSRAKQFNSSSLTSWDVIVMWVEADRQKRDRHVSCLLRCIAANSWSDSFIRNMLECAIIRENDDCKYMLKEMLSKVEQLRSEDVTQTRLATSLLSYIGTIKQDRVSDSRISNNKIRYFIDVNSDRTDVKLALSEKKENQPVLISSKYNFFPQTFTSCGHRIYMSDGDRVYAFDVLRKTWRDVASPVAMRVRGMQLMTMSKIVYAAWLNVDTGSVVVARYLPLSNTWNPSKVENAHYAGPLIQFRATAFRDCIYFTTAEQESTQVCLRVFVAKYSRLVERWFASNLLRFPEDLLLQCDQSVWVCNRRIYLIPSEYKQHQDISSVTFTQEHNPEVMRKFKEIIWTATEKNIESRFNCIPK